MMMSSKMKAIVERFSLMQGYYRDITLYNLVISLLIGLVSLAFYDEPSYAIFNVLLVFGIFGTSLGVFVYGYFKKEKYKEYRDLGFTKTTLIAWTWIINFCIASFAALFLSILL